MSNPTPPSPKRLLAWYDQHHRKLPWRSAPGEKPTDPYHVWLSEVMLQQTTVTAVKGYFERFTKLWPTVDDLADAELDEVLQEWAGLGYYARARNLHKAAKMIVKEFDGKLPHEISDLKKLPGVGDYTANAIRAIAFDKEAVVVDGNIERVMSRVFADATPLQKNKKKIKEYAASLMPNSRHGDYAQALMDLGATICTPTSPRCGLCPWQDNCQAYQEMSVDELPVKLSKKPQPVKRANAYLLVHNKSVLLERRPSEGLLGGMICPPTTEWLKQSEFPEVEFKGELRGEVQHVFTHIDLRLQCAVCNVDAPEIPNKLKKIALKGHPEWFFFEQVKELGLPRLAQKVIKQALGL